MNDKTWNQFTKILLDIMYVSGMLVFVTLPFTLKLAGKYYSPSIAEQFYPMLVVFAIASIFGILILGELRKMMKTVVAEDCFVTENVTSLNKMAMYSFLVSLVFIAKIFFLVTPATLIIIIVFFVAALFCIVLARVFAQAIQYKEENDLTI